MNIRKVDGNRTILIVFCYLLCIIEILSNNIEINTCPVKSSGFIDNNHEMYSSKPFVNGAVKFLDGKIVPWDSELIDATSPIMDSSTGKRIVIGSIAMMTTQDSENALQSAKKAWNKGLGEWPQMKLSERIKIMEDIVISLKEKRNEIINTLMWEICKSYDDAASEFDRTIAAIDATIKAFHDINKSSDAWRIVSGIIAKVKRAAIGIMLCFGPFNYPFNETYATLIPALLLGNVVIMKLPHIGGLVHILTMEVYAKHLPPGVLNFISGSGRLTTPPLMESGDIDILAFIGGKHSADALIKAHPNPHRLKVFLQLEGKNLGIVLPDANIDEAVEQVVVGSTSYNGQRCTAIKLVFVHRSIASTFLTKFIEKINNLKVGLPWEKDVKITPLPEPQKPKYLKELIEDSISFGATIINKHCDGGSFSGALLTPAILYPVTSDMKIWHEEQFGPVIPVAVFDSIDEIKDYLHHTHFGQQASVFTTNSTIAAELVDVFSTTVGRVNINTQCGRSPDVFPFSGRRSSAMGTMSITEAINQFSIETVIASKLTDDNDKILKDLENHSKFLSPL